MVTSLVFVLVVGWSLGWLVARSLVAEPVRRLFAALTLTLEERKGFRSFDWLVLTCAYWPTRFLSGVTHCAACSGFWIGILLATFGGIVGVHSPLTPLGTGLAVMGVNAVVDGVLEACLSIAYGDSNDG